MKIYKGILIGAIGYPIFQEFLGVINSLSQLAQNKLDFESAKLAKAAQDLVTPATEQEVQCIGFQYNPPEEEICVEESKK